MKLPCRKNGNPVQNVAIRANQINGAWPSVFTKRCWNACTFHKEENREGIPQKWLKWQSLHDDTKALTILCVDEWSVWTEECGVWNSELTGLNSDARTGHHMGTTCGYHNKPSRMAMQQGSEYIKRAVEYDEAGAIICDSVWCEGKIPEGYCRVQGRKSYFAREPSL